MTGSTDVFTPRPYPSDSPEWTGARGSTVPVIRDALTMARVPDGETRLRAHQEARIRIFGIESSLQGLGTVLEPFYKLAEDLPVDAERAAQRMDAFTRNNTGV